MGMYSLVERAEIPFISLRRRRRHRRAGEEMDVQGRPQRPHGRRARLRRRQEARADQDRAAFGDLGLRPIGTQGDRSPWRRRLGVEIVADETYGAKDTDVTAQLTKIRAVDGVQAIFVFGLGEGPAVVAKDIAQLGIKLPVYQSHGVASQEFIRLAGGAAEGERLPAAAILVPDQLPDSDPQRTVLSRTMSSFYTAKTGRDVSTFGGHARDAFFIWKAAVERAGSVDKAKVRDEIEKTTGFVGHRRRSST